MAQEGVQIKYTSDDSDLVASQRRQIAAQDKVIGRLREQKKVQDESDASNRRLVGTLMTGAKAYLGMLAGGGGVLATQKMITAELQKQVDLQDKQSRAQTTQAQAEAQLRRNLVGMDEAQIRQITEQQIPEMARRTGVSQKDLTLASAQAVSQSGGNVNAAMRAVEIAAQFMPDQPGSLGLSSGALLAMGQATGTQDATVNLGLLSKIGQLSPIADAGMQARNIPKAVIGQLAHGSSAQGAGALFASLAFGAADVTGESSGTAAISLAEQMKGFGGLAGIDSTRGRIAALQRDPAMAQRFLAGASFEKKFSGVIEQLLTDPSSAVARAYSSNLTSIADADLGAVGRSAIQTVSAGRFASAEDLRRRMAVAVESNLTTDPNAGIAGVVANELPELIDSAGASGAMVKRYRKFEQKLTAGNPAGVLTSAINQLSQDIRLLVEGRTVVAGDAVGGFVSTQVGGGSPEEVRMAETLTQIRNLLEQQLQNMESPGEAGREAGLAQ